jgi:hypothetical protein
LDRYGIKNLAVGLVAAGCEVRILVYGQDQDAVFKDENVVIQRIKNVKIKVVLVFYSKKTKEYINCIINANLT